MGDPVRKAQFDFIAKPRRFVVLCHARAKYRAVKIGSHQQLNRTGIAIWRGCFQNGGYLFVILFGDVNPMLTFT